MRQYQYDALLGGWMRPNFLPELNALVGKVVKLKKGQYSYGDRGTMTIMSVTVDPRTSDGYHWPTVIQVGDSAGGGTLVILVPAEVDEDRAPAYYTDRHVTPASALLIVRRIIELVVEE